MIKHTVAFNSNGGTAVKSQIINQGSTAGKPENPTKDGYDFVGWYESEIEFDFATPITQDITLTAKWELKEYTVTWKADGEIVEIDENVTYGTIPEYNGTTPTKKQTAQYDYTFVGWSPVVSAVYGNITYTALFIETVRSYVVTFNFNDETTTQIVNYGKTADKPENPIKGGYNFVGWFAENIEFDFATPITQDTTLTAKWSPKEYTINYELDGGRNSESNPATYTVESERIIFEDPTRTGFTFVGWYDREYGGNNITAILEGNTGDITLFAQWEIIEYTVTFNSNGGTAVKAQKVNHGDTIAAPQSPNKENYTFYGWFDGDARFDFSTKITQDLTLTAEWTAMRLKNNIVSDKAEITVIVPDNEKDVKVKVAIFDIVGNRVFEGKYLGNEPIFWNLRNEAGRAVAGGTYLIIAEAKGTNGKTFNYSAKLGVKK